MARFSDIVLALRDTIQKIVQDDAAVVVTARRELPALVGDKDILLRIRSIRENEGVSAAAGRYSMQIRRPIDIIIRARQNSDISQQDLQWLTDESNGILDIEAQLLDALEMWQPLAGAHDPAFAVDPPPTPSVGPDGQAYFLLLEPARITSSEDAVRDASRPSPMSPTDPGFGMLALRLDISYEQSLRQDIQ